MLPENLMMLMLALEPSSKTVLINCSAAFLVSMSGTELTESYQAAEGNTVTLADAVLSEQIPDNWQEIHADFLLNAPDNLIYFPPNPATTKFDPNLTKPTSSCKMEEI